MTSFTTRVFTRSYAETIHIFEIATNIPTMSGSLPEGAWTNDNNDNKGYLVRGIMDSFVFCNDDFLNLLLSLLNLLQTIMMEHIQQQQQKEPT